METHLKIEHLTPYLPYKLRCEVLNNGKEKEIGELMALYDDGSACFGNIVESEHGFEYIKPILRPLSDLTKEIEYNGDKFVPIEWFEIGDDVNESLEYDNGNIKLIRSLESISKYGTVNNVNYLPFGVVEKLFEWHFNVFNLPEKLIEIIENERS